MLIVETDDVSVNDNIVIASFLSVSFFSTMTIIIVTVAAINNITITIFATVITIDSISEDGV